ncbi:MAG: alpha/beta fold hydrolase [Bryobacteraceae bacterium]|nr:alpha/beta fold hydrolase [Bryobacteraceae bacterium]
MTIVLYIALIGAGLLLAGWIYQQVGERLDARRLPPPGEIRDGFHILRRGTAGPPIVLEAGIAATNLSWASVLKYLPEDRLVIAYDRLGFGWSDSPNSPRTLDTLAADLLRVLDLAGVHEPAILAAHSFGGLIVRRFAQLYPARAAALVLLDPLEPIEWSDVAALQEAANELRPPDKPRLQDEPRLQGAVKPNGAATVRERTPEAAAEQRAALLARGVMLSRRGILLARLGIVRFALALLVSGSRTLPKLLARASTGRRSTVTDRLVGEVRKMPAEVWPAVRAHWCLPRSFATMAEYLDRLPGNCRQAAAIELPASLPITVISAGNTQDHIKVAHAAYATRHIVAAGSGHWVQLDAPELAAGEILRMQ